MLNILFICFIIRLFGKENVEKALYRYNLMNKKEITEENIEEKLHKQAESLCKKPIKKNDKK